MLILTLSQRQNTLWIGEKITITLLSVIGRQARVGIEAPEEIVIHRKAPIYQCCKETLISFPMPHTKEGILEVAACTECNKVYIVLDQERRIEASISYDELLLLWDKNALELSRKSLKRVIATRSIQWAQVPSALRQQIKDCIDV